MFVERLADFDADVIVIGAGLGGSAATWQLTQHGLKVLVLEAGPPDVDSVDPRTRGQRILDRFAWAMGRSKQSDPRRFTFLATSARNSTKMRPVLTLQGRGLGGSSALYAAALGRFKRSDFANSVDGISEEPALPNAWPVDYDSFKAYYRRAETLMRVCGEQDPLDPDDDTPLPAPPALSPESELLRTGLERNGLHPYRLRVAIDYLPGCHECFGFRCARQCKGDGYNRAMGPALASGLATVETETQVLEIAEESGGVRVTTRDAEGRISHRRAARLVLSAGALNSPLLLDRSASLWTETPRPAMLGRGLMFHISDSFVVNSKPELGEGPRKWLAVRDFYEGGTGIGEIQSTGVNVKTGAIMQMIRARAASKLIPVLRAMAEFLRPAAWAIAKIIGERAVYATISEDLPHAGNRVREHEGAIVVDYTVDPKLKKRAKQMRSTLRKAFAPMSLRFLKLPGVANWGHPMGTCRMGNDPATSVTNAEGRVHGHDRIFVADASAFPSSGGVGPGLTVLALALRVADQIAVDATLVEARAEGLVADRAAVY